MAEEKRDAATGETSGAPEMTVRDLVTENGSSGAPATSGPRPRRARVGAPALLASLSLVLVLGSVGYFALNPHALSAAGGDASAQADGSSSEKDVGGSAHVEPGANPVEESSDGAGGKAETSDPDENGGTEADAGSVSGSSGGEYGGPGGGTAGGAGSSGASGGAGSKPGSDGSGPGGSGTSQQGGGGQPAPPSGDSQKPAPKRVTVSISVDSSAADGSVSASGSFTFEEGATVYDALCALGLSIGSSDSIHGVYVSSIGGLTEKQFGASSGWMYAVNGMRPNVACSAYVLKDGDTIQWRYVTG